MVFFLDVGENALSDHQMPFLESSPKKTFGFRWPSNGFLLACMRKSIEKPPKVFS